MEYLEDMVRLTSTASLPHVSGQSKVEGKVEVKVEVGLRMKVRFGAGFWLIL